MLPHCFFLFVNSNTASCFLSTLPPHIHHHTHHTTEQFHFVKMIHTFALLLCVLVVDARTFKAAFFYNGDISDLGWTYTHNEGRIRAQEALLPELEARGDSIHTDIFEALSSEDVKVMMKNVSESGYDMVIACSFMYHEETFAAAKAHPNVDFVHVSGYYSGPDNFITAFGRVYHSRYVSGVVAGGKSTVKRVGFIASIPIAEVYRSANAYYLGAQVGAGAIMNSTYVEHKVDVVVIWIGTFYDPVKEREAARRLHAMGCDVIAYHTDTQEGALYAKANGIHSVASNTDGRKIIGETVLTSSSFNWGPIYAELMNRSYLGTFRTGSHNLWYGYPAGVSVNHVPSFEVEPPTRKLFHSTVTKMKGGFDPFCHPVWKDGVRVQENVGDCLGDFYLAVKMQFIIDGPTDVGFMSLSGEACGNGTRYTEHVTQNPAAFDIRCHNCTAGMYSVVEGGTGVTECTPCPAGSFSGEGASECTLCPEGSYSPLNSADCIPCPNNWGNTGMGNVDCPQEAAPELDLTIIITISSVVAVLIFIAVPLVCYRVMGDHMRLSKLYSEKAVAMRCAESIACMRLEEVDDIRTIENPSAIIKSFVQIVDNLIEYRRFLPQTVLDKGDGDDPSVEESSATSFSVGRGSSGSHRSHRSTNTVLMKRGGRFNQNGQKKKMAFVMLNLVGFHRRVLTSESECEERHKKYVQIVQEKAQHRGGVPETFTGDRIIVTLNGVRPTGGYRESATGIGLEVLRQVKETLQLSASASVVAGSVLTGHYGSDTMKRYSTFGQSVSWGIALERVSKMHDNALMADVSITETCGGLFRFQHALFVVSPKAPRDSEPNLVSIVSSVLQLAENEWMYQLEEATQNPETRENKIFVAVQKGKWEEAEALRKSIPDDYVQNAELATMVLEQKLKFTDMSLW